MSLDPSLNRTITIYCIYYLSIADHYPDNVESLILQCMEWCDGYSLPLLVPLSSWLPDPRSSLVLSINVSEPISQICPTRNGQHLICATSKSDIYIYHVASRKPVKTLSGKSFPILNANFSPIFFFRDDGFVSYWQTNGLEVVLCFLCDLSR